MITRQVSLGSGALPSPELQPLPQLASSFQPLSASRGGGVGVTEEQGLMTVPGLIVLFVTATLAVEHG